MATFHHFARLPLELRIQIWEFAFVSDRILKVRMSHPSLDYWSPTPVPAVTRACQEARKHCSYQKAFITSESSRYIWTKFDSDIIQMLGSMMSFNISGKHSETKVIRRLRVELAACSSYENYELEFFQHKYRYQIRDLLKFESCDILVSDGLRYWCSFIEEMYWGVCRKGNVRIIDAETGEWIDEDTSGPYVDWVDTGGGESEGHARIDDDWDEDDEEQVAKRYNAMMKMKEPLPRIDLNY